jgi:hypothetical protein
MVDLHALPSLPCDAWPSCVVVNRDTGSCYGVWSMMARCQVEFKTESDVQRIDTKS